MDIGTLYDICDILEADMSQLADHRPEAEDARAAVADYDGESPFFKADRLYFYFYDGRYDRLKEAVIRIHKARKDPEGLCETSLSIRSTTNTGRSREVYYTGNVLYSDMLIRFSFVNQYNRLEQDLLYIFNPLERRDYTEGLLCGISSADLMPCAFKCIVTLTPCEDLEELRRQLIITPKEVRRWQKLNMFIVDNQG